MQRRRLGRTNLEVSELTIGTSAFGAGDLATEEVGAALAYALDRGIEAIELDAGDHAAVAMVAEALRRTGADRDVHVFARATSLVPFDLPSPHVLADQAYPGSHIRAEVEALLATLGMERLGIVLLHAWCPEWLDEGDWLETLGRLRQEGKIGGIGISLFDHDVDSALGAVASGRIDTVEVMYNIFDQAAGAQLLPLCRKHDVGTIIRSPLYFGALAPAIRRPQPFPPGDWRSTYFFEQHLRETRARVDRLESDFDRHPVPETALRFCLSDPAVSTVAIGMRRLRHIDANLAATKRGPLPPESTGRLKTHRWLC